MDFIMHACKRPDWKISSGSILGGVFILFFLSEIYAAQISGIEINHINGVIDNTMLRIDADIAYHLSKETRDALEHGVPLEFDIEFRIKKEREWFWDEIIVTKMITFRVVYQPLSGHYLVTQTNTGRRHQFRNLPDVLDFIGDINRFPLIGIDMIVPDKNYIAEIRAGLNIQALPAPLRPLAYISSQWQLSSSWQSWAIEK
jgi:hypothetical protein